MSDWEIDNSDNGSSTQAISNPSDWEIDHESNSPSSGKEGLGTSLAMAVPRVGVDLIKGGYHALQQIPDYYQAAKREVPGAINSLIGDPKHALGQAVAGLAEGGQNFFNFPHDIANYATNRLNLIPEDINKKIQMGRMPDSENEINATFGEPLHVGEKFIRGAGRNLIPLLGAKGLVSSAPHLTKYGATRTLNEARQLAEGRNIGALNVNPELIDDARQFLPNTLPHRNALDAAHYGDYNNLFKLQSDVGKNASDYARSLFSAAERSHGRAGLEARNRLLDAIHENLQSQGHNDISNLLRQGQNDYRRYMAFKPYRNILGLAAAGMLVPKNALTNIASKILSQKTQ